MIRGTSNITWMSKPDYDSWGADSYWSCEEWKQWYFALKNHFGAEEARKIWLKYASKVDSFEHFNWCRWNKSFAQFLKDNKLDGVDNILSRSGTTAASILDSGLNAARFVAKNIGWIALGLGVVYVGSEVYKNVKK